MVSAYPPELRTIGDHLRKRRLDLGLLQRQVAERLGVTKDTIVNWEKDHRVPGIRFVPGISEFLGYNPLPAPRSFREKLLYCQQVLGMSGRRLAQELVVDESTIRDWQRGIHRPTAGRTVEALRRLFRQVGLAK